VRSPAGWDGADGGSPTEPGLRVLVCGGRDFEDVRHLYAVLDQVRRDQAIGCVISGCARGADSLAIAWAEDASHHATVAVARFPADWGLHRRAAGPIRNQQMLDDGKPDLVVAFPGGRGTSDMVRRARAAGVRAIEVGAIAG
jgi:hypothetical protein